MSKLVVFQINKNLNKNYWVNLKISVPEREPFVQVGGTLPLADLTIEQYQKWQKNYQKLNYFLKLKTKIDNVADSIGTEVDNYIHQQKEKCQQERILLKERLDRWLKAPGFRHISKILKEKLDREEDILFLIVTSASELRQLPWHLWNVIETYPFAEIILSPKNELLPNRSPQFYRDSPQILAVVNNVSEKEFFKYKQESIAQLKSAKITFLYRSSRQKINEFLRKRYWDILFFHNGDRTREYKHDLGDREREYINIEAIESGLKIARDNGLQLAIFNTGDRVVGISSLEKINIPNIIVMREAVAARIAHKFFRNFLEHFLARKSLPLAVCSARKQLKQTEDLDTSWFPIVYQNYVPKRDNFNNENIELKENRNFSNFKTAQNISYNGTATVSKTKTINSTKTTANFYQQNPARTDFLVDRDSRSLEIKKIAKQEKSKNTAKTWQKINIIALVGLIFIGTKIYSIIFSFILVRFFENSNRYLEIDNLDRELSELVREDSNYQKKASLQAIERVPNGLFRYGGSASWGEIRRVVHPAIESIWPDFNLVYTQHPTKASNSDIGVRMLLDSQLSFAQISRPLTPAEHKAALNKNIDLQQIPIAIDAIVFTVHRELNISGLTLSQLKDIYTGKVTNWQELGGPDLPISPYSKSPLKSGTADFFSKNVLGSSNLSEEVTIVNSIPSTLQAINNNKGAIFYASASHIMQNCTLKPLAIGRNQNDLISPYQKTYLETQPCQNRPKELNIAEIQNANYPLSRYLYVIVKRNTFFDRTAGEAYVNLLIAREGQNLIRDSGFVPIY